MKRMKTLGMAMALLALGACSPQKNASDKTTEQTTEQQADTNNNQVVETIMARRSIRKYKPQPVEENKLQQIIECGIKAPNGRHLESWEVRILNTPELMEELNKSYRAYQKKMGKKRESHPSFGAPTLIFIAYNKEYDLSQVDCGLLGGNMILTAQSLGLGTCCLGGLARYLESADGADMLKRLDLPETHQLLYAIALGYPDEQPNAKSRDFGKVKWVK